ncbi:MAG: response regulator, partial [Nitrospinota bacterium]
KGAGIGLPLCHEIMQAHKGTLAVTSTDETGSSFTVSLPPVNPLILIVDSESEALTLKEMLYHPDFEILTADNEKQATDIIHGKKPHLVILNPENLKNDAIRYVAGFKKGRIYRDMLTILFCKKDEVECQEKAIQEGIPDFLIKPVRQSVLHNLIKRHLKYTIKNAPNET